MEAAIPFGEHAFEHEHEHEHGHGHGREWSRGELRGELRRQLMGMMAARHHERRHGRHGRHGFGPGFGPWGGGPGMFFGRGPKVGRGDVRTAILVLLAEAPMHGYQIIQELTERSEGVWRPSPGSVYPTLQQLEDEGLVRSDEVEGRRVFHLTDSGRAVVAKRGENATPPWEMDADAGPLVELREVGISLVKAVMQVAQTGTDRQIARAREILAETRKSLYRLLAEDDPAPGSGGGQDVEADDRPGDR